MSVVLSDSVAPSYLHQGPTGKPGLPGMPGADGPPVCCSLYFSFVFPSIMTESCFFVTKSSFFKVCLSLVRVIQERRAHRAPKETWLVTLNAFNSFKETFHFSFLGVMKYLKLDCEFVSFLGSQWSPGAYWLSWSSWPQGEFSLTYFNIFNDLF